MQSNQMCSFLNLLGVKTPTDERIRLVYTPADERILGVWPRGGGSCL